MSKSIMPVVIELNIAPSIPRVRQGDYCSFSKRIRDYCLELPSVVALGNSCTIFFFGINVISYIESL